MSKLVTYAADIGSIKKKRFGWARNEVASDIITNGVCITEFADSIVKDIKSGYNVALGFECPLFVPLYKDPIKLTSSRQGEGSRAWSAGAGCGALATGLTETLWILEYVFNKLETKINPTYSFEDILNEKSNLLLWEAFVTGESKGDSHYDDAIIAVKEFNSRISIGKLTTDVFVDNPYSLIGAALLRSGITNDLSFLSRQCVVVKA